MDTDNIISIILLVKSPRFLPAMLRNLKNQENCKLEIIAVIANEHKDLFIISDFFKITVIYKEAKLIKPDIMFELLPLIKTAYIAILNTYDLAKKDRFITQINFLKDNNKLKLVSCLEESMIGQESLSNIFITAKDIDEAVTSFYVPLNIYTFVFRRDFLVSIDKLVNNFNKYIIAEKKVYKEVSLILQFLKYTKIEKVPRVLYINRYCRSVRKNSKVIDYSLNSKNPLYIFNKSKYIARRGYIQEFLTTNNISKVKEKNLNVFKWINILIICTSLNIGGTESYLLNLWKALRPFKINVMILCADGFMAEIFQLRGINTFIFNQLKPYDKCKDYGLVFKLITKYKIKAILCETDDDIKISVKIAKIASIPVILQLHGLYYTKAIIKEYNKFFYYILCVSNNVKKYYLKCFSREIISNKLKVIPNFINEDYKINFTPRSLHERLGIPSNSKILLYVSRLSYSKGAVAENFLRAFTEIAKNDSNLYAVVIGDGERYAAIVEQGKYLNNLLNGERIFIMGAVDDLANYYSAAMLVVGTGRVALEAIFCQVPVLAYGLAGLGGVVSKKNINKMLDSNFYDHSFNEIVIKEESNYKLLQILRKFIYDEKIQYRNKQWEKRFIKYLFANKIAPRIKTLIYYSINCK